MHQCIHEPLISKKPCDEVQSILNRRWRYSPPKQEATKGFLGLLRCAECGGAITAEIQKGHTYYRCTKKSRKAIHCAQPYIREEALDAQVSELMKPYSLKPERADGMLDLIANEKQLVIQTSKLLVAQKQAEIEKVNVRLQRLLDSFLDTIIDRNDYTTEKANLMAKKKTIEEQKAAHAAW